ncbi:PEP/pyruvate-binding domain-containing protein [Kribbella shirazensis]|uniref:Phosphoenolpyruvate synthase n=1 Tax=Kribbella shirazensis TaxID=1105143 RepID=A0A7X5VER2_9ACTN|nr:PEP/pyruvate-binding domain-containing protein [Kribbella shirazensis]NIK59182.1 phosphoenolpyruvate synthase/pyruvate phosphate dikinase [Kribbella shirazensis]
MNPEYVVRLNGAAEAAVDSAQVGAKAARLTELARDGIRVPEGFAVTAAAYREFVRDARLGPTIAQAIRRYRAGRDLVVAAAEIRSAFRDAWLPPAVVDEILAAYRELGGDGTEVAVRCSPGTLPDGVQDEVFLHLDTAQDVLAACRRCFASLFGTVAVGNREALGVDHIRAAMPVLVQRMVRADLGGSGTAHGESTFVRVRASWGLGEPPPAEADQYSVHPGPRPMIVKHRGAKLTKTVYTDPRGTRTVETTPAERAAFVLADEELRELACWSVLADQRLRRPTTLEWAKDGVSGELYALEARPGAVPQVVVQACGRSVLQPQLG